MIETALLMAASVKFGRRDGDYTLAPHLQKIVDGAKTAPQWDTQADRRAIPATDAREKALREAALDRMKAASAALPEGPWEVWNSCSFRRITGPDGRDGGILCGVVQRSDNHPDLSMPEAQLRALCDLVNAARALIGEART